MGTAIVARVDTPPVLEFSEHVFDVVALAIDYAIVRDWDFSVGL